MGDIVKSWFKYFVFVCFFGVCINLIYLAVPLYIMVMYNHALFSFSLPTLVTMSVGVLISLVFMGVLEFFRAKILVLAGNDFVEKMVPFVVKSMHKGAVLSGGGNYSRGLGDLSLVREALVNSGIVHWLDLPWVAIYLFVLYLMHPLLCVVGVFGVGMVMMSQWLLKVMGTKRYVTADVFLNAESNFMDKTLQHAELVAGMGMLPGISQRFDTSFGKISNMLTQMDTYKAFVGSFVRHLYVVASTAVFGVGTYLYFQDQVSIGILFASVLIVVRLFYPFGRSLGGMKQAVEAFAAYKRLKFYVDTSVSKPPLSLPEPEGKLGVEGAVLKLGDRIILNNISFLLEPGETLAIAGPVAAGKTSLCKIVLGIWPAAAGKIRLDGAELSHWPQEELGRYMGYMPQESMLFFGTVSENIARMQECDSDKVIAACQKAGIHEMILKLPNGYDTRIDQNGKNLSAGQRQLIALARSLYGDPKVVVMDDPQNNLDEPGLAALTNAINALRADKTTVVMVTDRPNLLVNTDKLMVIREGQVAMYGPTQEVLSQLSNKQQAQS